MSRKLLFVFTLILIFNHIAKGQTKLGDNPFSIDTNSVLEVESTTKGILLPRLALFATNSYSPMAAFVAGMIVYNTSVSGVGPTAVTPGVYYCDGMQWVRTSGGPGPVGTMINTPWAINGNAGINPATDFLGTTDASPIILKTNNIEAARIDALGQFSIMNVPPGNVATDSLLVHSTGNIVKKVSSSSFLTAVQQSLNVVNNTGQTIFFTPQPITDPNKILLYRNGVQINFTIGSTTTIIAEIATVQGDEIKIVQIQ